MRLFSNLLIRQGIMKYYKYNYLDDLFLCFFLGVDRGKKFVKLYLDPHQGMRWVALRAYMDLLPASKGKGLPVNTDEM
jgi:hypothetical protein